MVDIHHAGLCGRRIDLASASAGYPVTEARGNRLEGTYQDFVSRLYADLDESIYALQATPELRQADSEDRISQDILTRLNQKGYQATHDTKTGGHVNLSIRLSAELQEACAQRRGRLLSLRNIGQQVQEQLVVALGRVSADCTARHVRSEIFVVVDDLLVSCGLNLADRVEGPRGEHLLAEATVAALDERFLVGLDGLAE